MTVEIGRRQEFYVQRTTTVEQILEFEQIWINTLYLTKHKCEDKIL